MSGPRTKPDGIATALFVALMMVVALLFFFCGCTASPKKPTTHTSVPSLDASRENVKRLRASIEDAKDGVSRLKARHELIDYKESLVK